MPVECGPVDSRLTFLPTLYFSVVLQKEVHDKHIHFYNFLKSVPNNVNAPLSLYCG